MKYLFLMSLFILTACLGNSSRSVDDKVIYFVIPDRFFDGDKTNNSHVDMKRHLAYHGGDLKGLTQKLDYIKELGVDTILTTPLMNNRDRDFFGHWGFHGYWIIDHNKLEEHLGTDADLEQFNKKRKELGLGYFADIVLNHVDWDHPWTKERQDYFHKEGDIKDWNDPLQVENGKVTGLPDLDQDHPEVFKKLMDYTKDWIDRTQASSIRLDAVKHIGHKFWKKFIQEIKKFTGKKKDFLFLGEFLHGDPLQYRPYIEDGFNAFFDYPLYYGIRDAFVWKKSLLSLAARIQQREDIFPDKIHLLTFLENHDMPRFIDLSDNISVTDLKQAFAFMMTQRGIPMIYYGMENLARGKTGEEGRVDFDWSFLPGKRLVKKMISLRKDHISFRRGTVDELEVRDDLYIYRRVHSLEESIVVIHRGDEAKDYIFELPDKDLFKGEKSLENLLDVRRFQIRNGRALLHMDPHDLMIFSHARKNVLAKTIAQEKRRLWKVKLKLTSALEKEDEVFAVGSNAALGTWDTLAAAGPFKDGTLSVLMPYKAVAEFKLIRKKEDGSIIWENGDNRGVFVNQKNKEIYLTPRF